jgi:hypothetical protein
MRHHPRYHRIYAKPLVGKDRLDAARSLGFMSFRKVNLDKTARALLEEQIELFKSKFGRSPKGKEPVFFDPDSLTPKKISLKKFNDEVIEIMKEVGIPEQHIYVYKKTGRILTKDNYSKLSIEDREEVEDAYDEFFSRG